MMWVHAEVLLIMSPEPAFEQNEIDQGVGKQFGEATDSKFFICSAVGVAENSSGV